MKRTTVPVAMGITQDECSRRLRGCPASVAIFSDGGWLDFYGRTRSLRRGDKATPSWPSFQDPPSAAVVENWRVIEWVP